jgi:hypothetical protein
MGWDAPDPWEETLPTFDAPDLSGWEEALPVFDAPDPTLWDVSANMPSRTQKRGRIRFSRLTLVEGEDPDVG